MIFEASGVVIVKKKTFVFLMKYKMVAIFKIVSIFSLQMEATFFLYDTTKFPMHFKKSMRHKRRNVYDLSITFPLVFAQRPRSDKKWIAADSRLDLV